MKFLKYLLLYFTKDKNIVRGDINAKITTEDKVSILESARELYNMELSQQNTYNTLFFTYLGAFAICISGLSFPYANVLDVINYCSGAFIVAIVLYTISLCFVFCILYYSYLHQFTLEYQRVPPISEIVQYAQSSDDNIYDLLIEYYGNAAQYNLKINAKKNSYFRVLKRLILLLVLFESTSYVSYSFVHKKDPIYNINLIGVTLMSNDKKQNAPQPTPQPKRPEPQYFEDEAIKKPQPQYIKESWFPKDGDPKRNK